jgi:diguanylate cyclase
MAAIWHPPAPEMPSVKLRRSRFARTFHSVELLPLFPSFQRFPLASTPVEWAPSPNGIPLLAREAAPNEEDNDMAVTLEEMMRFTAADLEGDAKAPSRRPGQRSASSDRYYQKIEDYARRIRSTKDVGQIVALLDEALRDTRALHGTGTIIAAEDRLHKAEAEIEALKAELERAVALTNLDPLTTLLNRRGLEASFAAEASRSDRRGSPMCAALIDIDDFKLINDTHGHPTGDAALTHLSAFMRASLRPNDVLARVGGEEFMILLPDSNEQAAFAALNRLLRGVSSHPVVCGSTPVHITFTAAVTLRAFGETQAAIYMRLDETLVRAKNSGKNRVMFSVS